MNRLLVVSFLDVVGTPNSRTRHLVRHLSPLFQETFLISRANIARESRFMRWTAPFCLRTEVIREKSIKWISMSPLGNIRPGLVQHLFRFQGPLKSSGWNLNRTLRRILSNLGFVLELGVLPSLLLIYIFKVRGRVDIFIGEGPWEIAFGLFLRSVRLVRTVIFDDIDYVPGFQPNSAFRRNTAAALEKLGARHSDAVISVSSRLMLLRREQGSRSSFLIPNGADIDLFAQAYKNRKALDDRRPALIYMGYLGSWSGIELILEAGSLLAKRIKDIRIIILGNGSPADLQAFHNGVLGRNLADIVDFRGEVSYSELPVHLAEADIGLAMLRPEDVTRYAFPLKVVEYMAAGLPVLTTEDTEAADIVRQAGAGMVVSYDALKVADATAELLTNVEECRRFSENAKAAAREYDWENLMMNYRSLLKNYCPPGS